MFQTSRTSVRKQVPHPQTILVQTSSAAAILRTRELNHTRTMPRSDLELQHDQASAVLPIIQWKYPNIEETFAVSLVLYGYGVNATRNCEWEFLWAQTGTEWMLMFRFGGTTAPTHGYLSLCTACCTSQCCSSVISDLLIHPFKFKDFVQNNIGQKARFSFSILGKEELKITLLVWYIHKTTNRFKAVIKKAWNFIGSESSLNSWTRRCSIFLCNNCYNLEQRFLNGPFGPIKLLLRASKI